MRPTCLSLLVLVPLLAACGPDSAVPSNTTPARQSLESSAFVDAVGSLSSKSAAGMEQLPSARAGARAARVRTGFGEVMAARVGPDGEVGTRCLESAEGAKAFLETANTSAKRAER